MLVTMSRHVDARTKQLADASSKPILAVNVDPTEDMREERSKSSFDSDEVAVYLNDGRDKLQRKSVPLIVQL